MVLNIPVYQSVPLRVCSGTLGCDGVFLAILSGNFNILRNEVVLVLQIARSSLVADECLGNAVVERVGITTADRLVDIVYNGRLATISTRYGVKPVVANLLGEGNRGVLLTCEVHGNLDIDVLVRSDLRTYDSLLEVVAEVTSHGHRILGLVVGQLLDLFLRKCPFPSVVGCTLAVCNISEISKL